ncbi:MAG: hypothetical protein HC909_02095 [Blastochloris sp.]|nr:hypothetical protein [Blastochloris sp.]
MADFDPRSLGNVKVDPSPEPVSSVQAPNVASRDPTASPTGTPRMEAYMIDIDLRTGTQAQPNRDPAYFDPLGNWLFDTGGGGARVPEEWLQHWPSRAVAPPSDTPPTAWISAAGYCVCPDVKDIIEELAPGVHQFIPLVLEAGPAGQRTEYPYFSVHVADRADEVIVEKSNIRWIKTRSGTFWSKAIGKPMAIPAASISGKHIWWNRRCNILLISGHLHDLLVDRGLASGLRFQKQIVV